MKGRTEHRKCTRSAGNDNGGFRAEQAARIDHHAFGEGRKRELVVAVLATAASTAGRSTSILALARRRGIAEIGVEWKDDGRSRVNPLKDMWKVISEALTIRRNLKNGVYNTANVLAAPAA